MIFLSFSWLIFNSCNKKTVVRCFGILLYHHQWFDFIFLCFWFQKCNQVTDDDIIKYRNIWKTSYYFFCSVLESVYFHHLSHSIRCECNNGYAGSGKAGECENFDECSEEVHNCDNNAVCIDREGTFDNKHYRHRLKSVIL